MIGKKERLQVDNNEITKKTKHEVAQVLTLTTRHEKEKKQKSRVQSIENLTTNRTLCRRKSIVRKIQLKKIIGRHAVINETWESKAG